MTKISILAIAVLAISASSNAQDECASDAEIKAKIFDNYDKAIPPPDLPVRLASSIWIDDIISFDEQDATLSIEMYYNDKWDDNRLTYSGKNPCSTNITVQDVLDKIWRSNTAFLNSRGATRTLAPEQQVFALLFENGTIWHNSHINVKASCERQTAFAPFDGMVCKLMIESFTANSDTVYMFWLDTESPVFSLKMPDRFTINTHGVEAFRYHRADTQYPAGRWSELVFSIRLRRYSIPYLRTVYAPQATLVLFAWLSTVLGASSVSARAIVLSLSLCGVVMIHAYGAIAAPTITMMDIWSGACITFILAAFMQLLSAVSRSRRDGKPAEMCDELGKSDKVMVLCMPIVFIAFNVVYWMAACIGGGASWPEHWPAGVEFFP